MIRFKRYLAAAAFLFAFSPMLSAAEPRVIGTYTVPLLEARERIVEWLQGAGFQVSYSPSDPGNVRLSCENADQSFLIEIAPQSPLASSVIVESDSSDEDADPVITGLRMALDSYMLSIGGRSTTARLGKLSAIESHRNAVVCLGAISNGIPVRFSGFAVDRRGFIITTAHDLEGVGRVAVTTARGKSLDGEVIKRDSARDLTLIKVGTHLEDVIRIGSSRRGLGSDERVYSLACSMPGREPVQAGVIDETPAVVEGRPLWRVVMEVEPGSSGSPVFDSEGRLAGMVKGKYRGTRTRGFLIPMDTILEFLRNGE